ncbi:MAG: hypothetical protein ABI193_09780 [Minicystis sp.]
MPLLDPPRVAYEDASCMVATWRTIVIPVMGRGLHSAAGARAQTRAIEAHGKIVGEGRLIEIVLIDTEVSLPGAEMRAALDAGVPIVSPYYGGVSAIFEGSGFRAALVRGVLTSFQMLSRHHYPQKTFATIEDCARWTFALGQELGASIASPREIVEAVESVRALALASGVFGPQRASAREAAGAPPGEA